MSKKELIDILNENIIHGDFLLSNERKSRFFVDMYGVLCDKQFLKALYSFFENEEINKEVVGIASFNGSPTSVVIGRLLAHEFEKEFSLFMVDRYLQIKDDFERIQPRGYIPKRNEKILIVSDIVVSGKVHLKLTSMLKNLGANPMNFTVVDRSLDNNEEIANDEIKKLNLIAAVKWNEITLPEIETRGKKLDMEFIREQSKKL